MSETGGLMNIDYHAFPTNILLGSLHHYQPEKYWRRRNYVVSSGGNKLLKLLFLFYIKRCDSYNNASLGTDMGKGAIFDSVPKLPHGLNGIVISPDAKIGKDCTIFHQVTIGNDYRDVNNVPTIGDNVTIFPGAKIVGKVRVGNNCKIGANVVITQDIPDNCIATIDRNSIIIKNIKKNI